MASEWCWTVSPDLLPGSEEVRCGLNVNATTFNPLTLVPPSLSKTSQSPYILTNSYLCPPFLHPWPLKSELQQPFLSLPLCMISWLPLSVLSKSLYFPRKPVQGPAHGMCSINIYWMNGSFSSPYDIQKDLIKGLTIGGSVPGALQR